MVSLLVWVLKSATFNNSYVLYNSILVKNREKKKAESFTTEKFLGDKTRNQLILST